jgi:hypothetical protein
MEGEIPGVANPANHDEESSDWKERKPGLMNEMGWVTPLWSGTRHLRSTRFPSLTAKTWAASSSAVERCSSPGAVDDDNAHEGGVSGVVLRGETAAV